MTIIGLWLMADVTHDVSLTRCDTMMMGMSIADADADGGGGCGGGGSVLATSFGHCGCKYHAGALNEYAVDGASLCANTASTPLVKVLVS